MKARELKELLQNVKDDADVCIINDEQDNAWEILECRVCEDKSSDFFGSFLDIVIKD